MAYEKNVFAGIIQKDYRHTPGKKFFQE